jgi:malate permease and related proteins
MLIYVFVLFGYLAKRFFKDQVQEKSFVLVYIYFLMPIIMIWGILSKPLAMDIILIPSYFLFILIISYIVTYLLSCLFLNDPKNQAIGTITGIIGNTGNMGIPIGLAVYGIESVPYTAMINLFNAVFVMTVGAYTYSRGTFTIKKSIINVIKLPMIWATIIAFIGHYFKIELSQSIFNFLEMGAYTGIVIQLIIFGMFLADVNWNCFYPRIASIVLSAKFILLPLLALMVIKYLNLNVFYSQILLLQALVPIAVNNVNLAALYGCYPNKVAWVSFIAFILATILLPIGLSILPKSPY